MKEKERKAFYDDDSNWKPHLEDRDFRVLKLRYKRLTFYRAQAKESIIDYVKGRDKNGNWIMKTYWGDIGRFLRIDGEDIMRASSITDAREWMRQVDREESCRMKRKL